MLSFEARSLGEVGTDLFQGCPDGFHTDSVISSSVFDGKSEARFQF